MKDQATQYEFIPIEKTDEFNDSFLDDVIVDDTIVDDQLYGCHESDTEWLPPNDMEMEEVEEASKPMDEERKLVVFKSCLLQLFAFCSFCLSPKTIDDIQEKGTMVTITGTCVKGHVQKWKSQPEGSQMPWGNFLVAASCLFSGMQPSKMLTFFRNLNLASISERLYSLIQTTYFIPAVFNVWEHHQQEVLSRCKGRQLLKSCQHGPIERNWLKSGGSNFLEI
eukprot:gene20924-22979_t